MSKNEKFVLYLVSLACASGLLIPFLPTEKAVIYAPVPIGLLTIASTYLNPKKDD